MSYSTETLEAEDLDPIDVAETLAEHYDWEFDRVADNQIAMAVEGQWRTYSVTVAWSDYDATLRLVCSFELDPPEQSLPALYECLNETNDRIWSGAFTYWSKQKIMVLRHGVILENGTTIGLEALYRMIATAVLVSEQYYPAFQLVCHSDRSPKEALEVAIAEAYGHA